jgi:hypothetical protein
MGTNQRRCLLTFAAAGALLRAIGGILVAALSYFYPEANALALFDIPTLGVYMMATLIGFGTDIVNASDIFFFFIGLATWTVIGLIVGFLACRHCA